MAISYKNCPGGVVKQINIKKESLYKNNKSVKYYIITIGERKYIKLSRALKNIDLKLDEDIQYVL